MKQHNINIQIKARIVNLIDYDGNNLGEKSFQEALLLAKNEGLDLVELVSARNGSSPVCRLLDYGKFQYAQSKKERGNKRNQLDESSEIRVGIHIAEHDLQVKIAKILDLLESKSKQVKVTARLRGREQQHPEIAMALLKKIFGELQKSNVVLERAPKAEGNSIFMVLRKE